jgi:MATE family multidrug resistance protein
MYITFIGLAANVAFNFVFIKQFGVQGAAWATLGVRLIMAVVMGFYIFNSHIFKHITKVRTSPKRIKELTGQILKLSVPGGLQFFFEIGAFSFAVVMMGWISENALAAHQIAINIAATTYMMASGIAYAGSIRVGNSLGHKSITGVKVAGNSAFMLVFVFMTLAALLIFVFRHQLVQVYIRNEEIEALAVGLLFIAAFFQLSDGIQVVALGVLRGVSDVNVPAVITFIAYWIIALPLGYVLAFYTPLGAQGIWIALLSGLSFAAIFLTLRFYRKIKRESI